MRTGRLAIDYVCLEMNSLGKEDGKNSGEDMQLQSHYHRQST